MLIIILLASHNNNLMMTASRDYKHTQIICTRYDARINNRVKI